MWLCGGVCRFENKDDERGCPQKREGAMRGQNEKSPKVLSDKFFREQEIGSSIIITITVPAEHHEHVMLCDLNDAVVQYYPI